MNDNWMDLWKGYSYDEIIKELPNRIGEMSNNFSVYDFFTGQYDDERIACLVVTPYQVCVAYTPGRAEKMVHHATLIQIIKKEMNISSTYPCLCFDMVKGGETLTAFRTFIGERISGEMRELYLFLLDLAEDIKKRDSSFWQTLTDNKDLIDTNLDNELFDNWRSSDEKAVGMPIAQYIRKMKAEELKRAAKKAKAGVDILHNNQRDSNKTNINQEELS